MTFSTTHEARKDEMVVDFSPIFNRLDSLIRTYEAPPQRGHSGYPVLTLKNASLERCENISVTASTPEQITLVAQS